MPVSQTIAHEVTPTVGEPGGLDYVHVAGWGPNSSGFRARKSSDTGAKGSVELCYLNEGSPLREAVLYFWEPEDFDSLIGYLTACKRLFRGPALSTGSSADEAFVHPYNDESGRWDLIAEVYLGGYEWAIACVWRDRTTGRLYGDTDSGCSCYGPFEGDGYALGHLKEVVHQRDAAALLDGLTGEDGGASTTARHDFVRAVGVALAQ